MEFSLHFPLFLKVQGNEVEEVKTPTVRSWEVYIPAILFYPRKIEFAIGGAPDDERYLIPSDAVHLN
jgi:hypothetical protein